jgi:hypothetical protein
MAHCCVAAGQPRHDLRRNRDLQAGKPNGNRELSFAFRRNRAGTDRDKFRH